MIEWILANISTLCEIFTGAVAVCSAVAGLTPTKKDDGVVATVVKVADKLSIFNTKKDQATLDKAKK